MLIDCCRYVSKLGGTVSLSRRMTLVKIQHAVLCQSLMLAVFGSPSMDQCRTSYRGNSHRSNGKYEFYLVRQPWLSSLQQTRVKGILLGLQLMVSHQLRLRHILVRYNASALRSRGSTPGKRSICLFSSSLIQTLSKTRP